MVCVLEAGEKTDVLLVSQNGFAIRFDCASVPVQGRTAGGVRAIALEKGDAVLMASQNFDGDLVLFSQKGYAKRIAMADIAAQNRAGKGNKVFPLSPGEAYGNALCAALVASRAESLSAAHANGGRTEVPALDIPLDTVKGEPYLAVSVGANDEVVSVLPSFVVQ